MLSKPTAYLMWGLMAISFLVFFGMVMIYFGVVAMNVEAPCGHSRT